MTSTADKLKTARAKANAAYYDNGRDVNHPAFVAAMSEVKALVEQIDAAKPREEFCSVDSGIHRTRLSSGRIAA